MTCRVRQFECSSTARPTSARSLRSASVFARRSPTGANAATATFTLPERPVRRRIHGIQSFCTLRGGEYLFMPGLRALRRLGGLDG